MRSLFPLLLALGAGCAPPRPELAYPLPDGQVFAYAGPVRLVERSGQTHEVRDPRVVGEQMHFVRGGDPGVPDSIPKVQIVRVEFIEKADAGRWIGAGLAGVLLSVIVGLLLLADANFGLN